MHTHRVSESFRHTSTHTSAHAPHAVAGVKELPPLGGTEPHGLFGRELRHLERATRDFRGGHGATIGQTDETGARSGTATSCWGLHAQQREDCST
jgi:hypothetical protein